MTSRFVGVHRTAKKRKPWTAACYSSGKQHHLGYFASEEEAALAYDRFVTEKGLNRRVNIPDPSDTAKPYVQKPARARKMTSRFAGVHYIATSTGVGPWHASCMTNGRKFHLGSFPRESEAALAYDAFVREHGLNLDLNYPNLARPCEIVRPNCGSPPSAIAQGFVIAQQPMLANPAPSMALSHGYPRGSTAPWVAEYDAWPPMDTMQQQQRPNAPFPSWAPQNPPPCASQQFGFGCGGFCGGCANSCALASSQRIDGAQQQQFGGEGPSEYAQQASGYPWPHADTSKQQPYLGMPLCSAEFQGPLRGAQQPAQPCADSQQHYLPCARMAEYDQQQMPQQMPQQQLTQQLTQQTQQQPSYSNGCFGAQHPQDARMLCPHSCLQSSGLTEEIAGDHSRACACACACAQTVRAHPSSVQEGFRHGALGGGTGQLSGAVCGSVQWR